MGPGVGAWSNRSDSPPTKGKTQTHFNVMMIARLFATARQNSVIDAARTVDSVGAIGICRIWARGVSGIAAAATMAFTDNDLVGFVSLISQAA